MFRGEPRNINRRISKAVYKSKKTAAGASVDSYAKSLAAFRNGLNIFGKKHYESFYCLQDL